MEDKRIVIPPVAITTLDRFVCLKKCLESLAKCTYSDETEVYVSVDYPPADKYKEGNSRIISYLNSTKFPFKKLSILTHTKNKGAVENSLWLKKYVFERHDRIIMMEDDTEVAPCYLDFCAKGLMIFENDSDIIAINPSDYVMCANGYTPPIRHVEKGENSIEKRQLIWHSYATWKNEFERLLNYVRNDSYLCIGDNPELLIKLFKKSKTFAFTYLNNVYNSRKRLPWHNNCLYLVDSVWDICMLVFNKYVICPIEPISRDNGVFGNGSNFLVQFSNADELSSRKLKEEDVFSYTTTHVAINTNEILLHDTITKIRTIRYFIELIKYIIKFLERKIRKKSISTSTPW